MRDDSGSHATRYTPQRVETIDNFFAAFDAPSPTRSSTATLSITAPLWETDDLLLTILTDSADVAALSDSGTVLTDDQDANEELIDELLAELAGVGGAFETL